VTEPDTPDPSTSSGEPWWTPLTRDAPSPRSSDDWGAQGDAAARSARDEPSPAAAVTSLPVAAAAPPVEPIASEPAAEPIATEPEPEPEPAPWTDPDPEPEPEAAPGREEESSKQSTMRAAVEWVAVVVGALLVALVVKTFLFQAFYIPSESMEPTLEKGDRVIVNKLSYDLHDVNRGDIIVFELDQEDVGPDGIKDLIKRVIGLPGDTIETRDGAVYIDDRRLEEPYLPEGTLTGDPTNGTNPEIARQVVPDGTVYVLGDNRDNSADSRYATRGPIPIDDIVGRAFLLVWPPGEIAAL